MAYNQFNIRATEHILSVSGPKILQRLQPGMGVNCNDVYAPVPAERHPFWETGNSIVSADNSAISSDTVLNASTSFLETENASEMSNALRANLRGSYGFASAEAALSQTSETMSKKKVILALITSTLNGTALPESRINWSGQERKILERIEELPSIEERQDAFVRQFGSHYVSVIETGYRLAVAGEYESDSKEERMAFAASFKAQFGGGGAGGDISIEDRKRLTSERTSLRSELVCGGIEPDRPLILGTYQEIVDLLRALKAGEVVLRRGAVRLLARGYFSSLLDFPKTREAFATDRPKAPNAPYGVPAGTVIAWYPPNDAIFEENGVKTVSPPEGWAIADGVNHPLDLRGRFVLGASDPLTYGETGGTWEHSHSARVPASDPSWWLAAGGGNQQFNRAQNTLPVQVDAASVVPPYGKCIYLVKL